MDVQLTKAEKSIDRTIDLDFWDQHGFAFAREAVFAPHVERLKSEYARLLRDINVLPRPPLRYKVEDPSKQDKLEMLSHPHWASKAVEEIAVSEELGSLVASLLKVDRIRLWGTAFICKYGTHTSRNQVAWHRDMTFWQCLDAPRLLTFWIPLNDVVSDSGGIEFANGSHHIDSASIGDDSDLESFPITPFIGRAGAASVHHCLTGHRSSPNRSEQDRLVLTLHYMDADLRYVPGTSSDSHINVPMIAYRKSATFDDNYFPVVHSS